MDQEILLTALAAGLAFGLLLLTIRLTDRRKGAWDRRTPARSLAGRRSSDRPLESGGYCVAMRRSGPKYLSFTMALRRSGPVYRARAKLDSLSVASAAPGSTATPRA